VSLGVLVLVDAALLGVCSRDSLVPRWLGFAQPDRMTILFCGSKKSMASGLPMATALFAGHGSGCWCSPSCCFTRSS